MSGWQPTPLALDDAEIVLALERVAYPESDVATRPYYDWLYRANPAGEGLIWYAATGDAEVPSAGHYAVVPLRVAVAGEPVMASLSLNTLTHPRYRRQGVFTTLAERVYAACRARGIAFTYGFPNPSSHPGFAGPLGFTTIGRLPLLVAPLGGPGGGRPLVALAARAARPLSALVRAWYRGPRAAVREERADSDVWDALWTAVRGKYPVRGVRAARHVAWRYGRCPTRRYRLYAARDARGVRGFVATRVDRILGMRAGLVVDLVVRPGDGAALAGLLEAALAEFATAQAALAVALASPHTEEHVGLRHAGFFPCPRALEPQPFPVILRRHAEAPPVPDRLTAWLLAMGDYDAV